MALTFFGGRKSGGGGDGTDTRLAQDQAMQQMLAEVQAYWEGLRKGKDLPRRAMIDPRGMRGALQGTFLAERIAPGVGRLRIAGMNFTDLLGMDGRGMPISALFDPMSRARLSSLLDTCFLRPAILDLTLGCETGLGRPDLRGRMLLLPLGCDDGRGEMVLGCLAMAGQIGRQPRRLTIEAASCTALELPRLTAISPLRDLEDLAANPPMTLPEVTDFAPIHPPKFAVKPSAKARSYLKLVDLGR